MIISVCLREPLSTRFSDADFTPYFVFLESLSQTNGGHKHHILPRNEFPEYVKAIDNLICVSPADHFRAHYYLARCAPQCESFQVAFYLMANYKQASQIHADELPQYSEIYKRGRENQVEIARAQGRIHGPINGRKNAENGHMERMRAKTNPAVGGRIAGRKNVENGTIQALGRIWGRKSAESGRLNSIRTPESCARGGRIGGRKNAESGQIQALGHTQGCKNSESGHLQNIGRLGGRVSGLIQGRKNVESGHLAKVRVTALHVRWHANRNISNPACRLCSEGQI